MYFIPIKYKKQIKKSLILQKIVYNAHTRGQVRGKVKKVAK